MDGKVRPNVSSESEKKKKEKSKRDEMKWSEIKLKTKVEEGSEERARWRDHIQEMYKIEERNDDSKSQNKRQSRAEKRKVEEARS